MHLGVQGPLPPKGTEKPSRVLLETSPELDAPDFYAYAKGGPVATIENAARFNPPSDSWSLVLGMRPRSRGTIHLTGPDAADPVSINANYLGDPRDLKTLIAGLRTAREIGNSAALRTFTGREIAPGPLNATDL